MASTAAGDNVTRTPLPSFEELFRAERRALLTKDTKRLRWALDSPLTTAISVMQEPYHGPEVASPEPYFNSREASWHAVSQAPYTDPKISSVTVTVSQLEDWEDHGSSCTEATPPHPTTAATTNTMTMMIFR